MSHIEVNSSDQNLNLLNLSEVDINTELTLDANVPELEDLNVELVHSDAVLNENVAADLLTDAYFLNLLNENSDDPDQVNDLIPASLLETLNECSPEKNEMNEEITDIQSYSHVNDTLVKILDHICEINSQSNIIFDDCPEIKNDEISDLNTGICDLGTDAVNLDEEHNTFVSRGPGIEPQSDTILHESLLTDKEQYSKEDDLKGTYVIETSPASPKEQKLEKFQLHRATNELGDCESDSWTDDESASSTSSSDSDFFLEPIPKVTAAKLEPVKTKGELDIEDLPPIEELTISVNENELVKIGKVHAIVVKQVVIQAVKEKKPLDMDSVLFLSCNKPLGRIFEVFGPVIEPFYVVLFNSPEDIINKDVTVGADVYFAPEKTEITSYVFVDLLRQQKGSDASWKDNNEPPEEYVEYSDDEQERIAKLRRKARNRTRDDDEDDIQLIFPRSSETKIRKVSSSNDVSGNYSMKKFNTEGCTFSATSENVFQGTYNAGKNLNGTISESNRFSGNHSYSSTSSSNNVPVWITTPPPFLVAQQNVFSTPSTNCPPQHSPQPTVSPIHPQHTVSPIYPQHTVSPIHFQNLSNAQSLNSYFPQQQSPQPQLRPSPLLLLSKQPFVSHQMPNHNTPPVVFQPQSPFSPILRSASYLPPPQSPLQQNISQAQSPFSPNLGPSQSFLVQQNVSQSPGFYNYNQPHMFGQVTAIAAVSPSIPFSSPAFSPRPALFMPPNSVGPTNFYSTPPPNVSDLSRNCPIPPPRPPPNNFYLRNYR